MWYEPYDALDYLGGTANYICDDLEDMIEITYPDGMLIDVGRAEINGIYYITVVASNDLEGWKAPLYELAVPDKADLADCLQRVIRQVRNV